MSAFGLCWNTSGNPSTYDTKTTESFTPGLNLYATLSGLNPGKRYYAKAYVVIDDIISYSNEFVFNTFYSTLTDYDGNTYNTVRIGLQEWMAENLKVTHYTNGSEIQKATGNTGWLNNTIGTYAAYGFNDENVTKYGYLYDWYSLNYQLAPSGWHIPTQQEWDQLINYLGATYQAKNKLISTLENEWPNNALTTNESSFSALPAGSVDIDGNFFRLKNETNFWTKTTSFDNLARNYCISSSTQEVQLFSSGYKNGYSVRLVKN